MRNFSRSGEDLIRDAINERRELPFDVSAENLIFGQPTDVLDQTQVAIRGVQNSDYRNRPMVITYEKLDLSVLFGGNYRPEVTALGQSSLHRLLPEFSKALGIQLTPNDIEDVDVTQLGEGNQLTIELRAKPGSRAYRGFTRVTFHRRRIYLWDVVETRFYDELLHPDPLLAGHRSAGLLTWGLDFSLIYRDLEVRNSSLSWRGQYRYLSRLKESLELQYGIDNWPGNELSENGRLRDYDTRSIPEANTDFQRVVVQNGIRANGYIGTAYFHYNRI
jgi:hypothetical protein